MGIQSGDSQRIGADPARETPAPVHGDESVAGAHLVRGTNLHDCSAASAGYAREVAIREPDILEIGFTDYDFRLRTVAEETRNLAGARHAVPMVAQTPRREPERIGGV